MERAQAEHLKDIGLGIDAPADVRDLVEEAYSKYRASCLWSIVKPPRITIGTAMVVAGYLKRNGNTAAFRLADQIESACDAAIRSSSANH
jgi:hypothetical protein